MVIGIVIGFMIFVNFPDKKAATQVAGYISIMSDVFLRLIKMLIGPWSSPRWWWASPTWATPPRSGACSPRRWAGS